eukprot:TRINITY_DN16904_c0_g1_i1.p1 TRINITY_DN16904_c0_g1~~TRINITY_DN16904_c0_g1_i1.p1  ORF type:complete len:101 (-),score=15.03 TRINITY_DN16904_c0_g1_i1:84-347(-)
MTNTTTATSLTTNNDKQNLKSLPTIVVTTNTNPFLDPSLNSNITSNSNLNTNNNTPISFAEPRILSSPFASINRSHSPNPLNGTPNG